MADSAPPDDLIDELAALAAQVARIAGEAARHAREGGLEVDNKSSQTDLVTDVDRATEALIVERISAARPGDGFAGEEGTDQPSSTGVVWHIDPIDGTTNFVYGLPGWSVSVAAEIERPDTDPSDAMAVGAVYDPSLDELFTAARGRGAQLDGEPIATSTRAGLATALVATGFSYDPATRRRQGRVLAELAPVVGNIRRFGSAAIDLCLVAAGRVDAYYEADLNLWDRAAGELIALEAGARVHDLHGGPPSRRFVFASAPSVHDGLRDLLVDVGADVDTVD